MSYTLHLPRITCPKCGSDKVMIRVDAKVYKDSHYRPLVKYITIPEAAYQRLPKDIKIICLCKKCGHRWVIKIRRPY